MKNKGKNKIKRESKKKKLKIGKLKEEAWCARGKSVDSGCVVVATIKASQRLVVQRGWSLHGRTLTLSGLRQSFAWRTHSLCL